MILVANSITATIKSVTIVSGMFSTSILIIMLATVITLEKSWGRLWLIIWRRVSMSLV